jgi:L-rhamnose mutarotase
MRIAFKMKLNTGCREEYKKRHDAIWPELRSLLKRTGVRQYSIFLDEATDDLFGSFHIDDESALRSLPKEPVMKKWWDHMKDIMETNTDQSPVSIALTELFYME